MNVLPLKVDLNINATVITHLFLSVSIFTLSGKDGMISSSKLHLTGTFPIIPLNENVIIFMGALHND